MKNTLALALLLLFIIPLKSFAFDKEGHSIAASIAKKHLSKKASKNISKYLNNHDIVYYASWMDYLGYVTKSGYCNEWFDHCVPVNENFEYAEKAFPGDALLATETAIERLKDGKYKELDDSTVFLLIKHLVHFLPDMHCPSHVIYTFRPSNYVVTVDGKNINFHTVWDGMINLGPHKYSVSEWVEVLNYFTKEEQAQMIKGTPRDWVHENAKDCIVAYEIVPEGKEVEDPQRYQGSVILEKQIMRAGLRLALVLNTIFEK
ncbi:MAG: S1/P1 nuclease [Bacteroidales bacterium]|nr:S1/P1 nuclease [Bacteroidales bacterium]